ncbi:MAG: hypothetical protein IJD54_00180 [Clostridia bacterium]|nr:hypothetical protein [Clostridia bacterium]
MKIQVPEQLANKILCTSLNVLDTTPLVRNELETSVARLEKWDDTIDLVGHSGAYPLFSKRRHAQFIRLSLPFS